MNDEYSAELRKKFGISRENLAKRVGISPTKLARIEHGQVVEPELLVRMRDAVTGRPEPAGRFESVEAASESILQRLRLLEESLADLRKLIGG